VFYPTLRTHMVHGVAAKQAPQHPRLENVWRYEEQYAAPMEAALRLRGRLVPYLYTAAMDAYRTGVSIVHPLYYPFPHEAPVYETGYGSQVHGRVPLTVPATLPLCSRPFCC
jgi:alpha-glucosidase (family GH31 glycosyl hydrolase)